MADSWELEARHENGVELEKLRQHHRLEIRNMDELKDAEVEVTKGENERNLVRLKHDLDIENRQINLQAEARKHTQDFELEAMQTMLKQQDDFVRHFWEIDKEVTSLESRVIELWTAGEIKQRHTKIDHSNSMEGKTADHSNALEIATHNNELDKDNFEFKLKVGHKYGEQNVDEVAKIIATLEEN